MANGLRHEKHKSKKDDDGIGMANEAKALIAKCHSWFGGNTLKPKMNKQHQ